MRSAALTAALLCAATAAAAAATAAPAAPSQPDPAALRAQAEAARDAGHFKEALKDADALIAASQDAGPDALADAWAFRGKLCLAAKDGTGADVSFRRAVEQVRDHRESLENLVELMMDSRRPAEALMFQDRLAKTHVEALQTLIAKTLARGWNHMALQFANHLVRDLHKPAPGELADAYELKADVELKVGDTKEGEQSLRRAVELAPDRTGDLARLLDVAMEGKRFSRAKEYAARLLEASAAAPAEDRAALWRRRAEAELGAKDPESAERSLLTATQLAPRRSEGWEALIALEQSRGELRQAADAAARLIEAASEAPAPERAGLLRRRAGLLLALGDAAGSEAELRRAGALEPGDPGLWDQVARLSAAGGRPKDALDAVDRLIAAGASLPAPALAAAYERRASLERRLADPKGEEESLRRALSLDPGRTSALRALEALLEGQGRLTDAAVAAEALVAASTAAAPGERASALEAKARLQRALKDDAGAEASLRGALGADAGDRAARRELFQLLFDAGRMKEALPLARRLTRSPGGADAADRAADLVQLAQTQRALGDERGAAKSVRRALRLLPSHCPALQMEVELARDKGRGAEALEDADRLVAACAAAPAQARAVMLDLRAGLRLDAGDAAGALDDARAALKAAPGDAQALWLLALAQDPPARATLDFLDEARPRDGRGQAVWRLARGAVRAALGQRDAAREDLDAGIAVDAEAACFGAASPPRRERLSPLYFDACLARFPRRGRLYVDRGVALYRAGSKDAAEADFRKAVELAPDSPEARLSLATALAARGARSEALAECRSALERPGAHDGPVYAQLSALSSSLRASP